MKTLLYLIYGNQRTYHLELTYSVLSAARFLRENPADMRIVLACDAANQRADLPVQHLIVPSAMLSQWQLGGTFDHSAKLFALRQVISQFASQTVMIDSDTVMQKHPRLMFDRIRPGRALLHAREGVLAGSAERREWMSIVGRLGPQTSGYSLDMDSMMFNSGVIGLDPEDGALLDDAIAVMKRIRQVGRIFTAEQMAASLVLGTRTEVSTCEDLVEHYWNGPRSYYRYQMGRMFPNILQGGGVPAADASIQPLNRTPPRRILDRAAARIRRVMRGASPEYGYAYVAYLSAMSCRASDKDLANVWATNALDALTWGVKHRQPKADRDFAAFAPGRLEQAQWMAPALRSRWYAYWAAEKNQSADNASR